MSARTVNKVIYHHRTQGRGVEAVHIRGVVDALRARGILVEVLSLPNADPYQERQVQFTPAATPWKGVGRRLPEPVFELLEIAFNLLSLLRVRRALKHNPDATFIYERYALFLFSTVLIARWRRMPIVLEINDSAAVPRVRPLFFKRLALMIEKWIFRSADALIFVSGEFRDQCSRIHGVVAPAIVSHNAANIADFSVPAGTRERVRSKYGLGDALVCGYLGAFVPWHRIDQFVRLIADRLPDAPDLKLLLVGDGATYSAVREFVRERRLDARIVLTGRVPHSQVAELLGAMDYAVLPDAGDYTSPVKLFEFMAAGVPAVAPDHRPLLEVLHDGQTGWLFPAGDIGAAADRVLDVSRNVQKLREIGVRAKECIAREHQWSNNIDQLLRLYDSVAPPPC